MPQTGIVILIYGNRGDQTSTDLPESLHRVTEGVKALLPPGTEVLGAALQFNDPDIEKAISTLISHGAEQIVIMPYFLFRERHITEDVSEHIKKMKIIYPNIDFIMTEPLDTDPGFISNTIHCIEEAVPILRSNYQTPVFSPEAIEKQSMEIVEKLIPPDSPLSTDERSIVKRIIHASGDPDIASSVRFSSSAISSGLNAINNASPIFTDVNMVASGISKQMTDRFGCSVSCALDIPVEQNNGEKQNNTRAAAAIYNLGKRLNDSIIAIGNAPTALLAVLDLIEKKEIMPALIVGMPVGFIQAKESKYELMKQDIPYITIVGTRGGSAMAAATVNALLKICVDRKHDDRST
jgi:precorrin-8X/cobalt-precorrin-8 methylmutase